MRNCNTHECLRRLPQGRTSYVCVLLILFNGDILMLNEVSHCKGVKSTIHEMSEAKLLDSEQLSARRDGDTAIRVPNLDEHSHDEFTRDGTLNFYGQPALKSKFGASRSVSAFYVAEFFDTVAWSGASNNLVVYLTTVMHMHNAGASNFVSRWTGAAYFSPFVTAIVSDSYWGRFWTSIILLGIFVHGLAMLSLSASLTSLHPTQCKKQDFTCPQPSSTDWTFFTLAIYIFGIGGGAVTPMQAFAADQFDENDGEESEQKSIFFNRSYQSAALGKLVNVIAVFPVQQYLGWGLGFGISASACLATLLVFSAASPTFRYQRPQEDPCKEIAQVFIACIRNWRLKSTAYIEDEASAFTDALAQKPTLRHARSLKLLDKATIMPPPSVDKTKTQIISQWRVCSRSQVDAVKCLLYMLPIMGMGIIYKTVNLQLSTLFVLQGQYMDRHIGPFQIPSASLNMFEHLSVVLWVLAYDRVFVRLVANFTGNPRGITNFQRIGIGLAMSICSLVIAAMVESRRLTVGRDNRLQDMTSPVPMSVFWNIPQYAVFGASEVFVDIGLNEFFYNQSPIKLRTVGTSFIYITTALGSYLSVFLVNAANQLASRNAGEQGWITDNLNQGHLNYFYYLLAGLSAVNLMFFMYISRFHYISQEQISGALEPGTPSLCSPEVLSRSEDESSFRFHPNAASISHPDPGKSPLHSFGGNPLLKSPYRTFR